MGAFPHLDISRRDKGLHLAELGVHSWVAPILMRAASGRRKVQIAVNQSVNARQFSILNLHFSFCNSFSSLQFSSKPTAMTFLHTFRARQPAQCVSSGMK
jgi:hypothetical protein